MSHNTLENYYQTIFALRQYHGYGISEVEDLVPFERDLYVELLNDYLEKKANGGSTVDPGIAEYDRMLKELGIK